MEINSIFAAKRLLLSIATVAAAGSMAGCLKQVWNAGDLTAWVKDQAVEKGCVRQSIELKEWYDSENKKNIWHGSCSSEKTGERMDFAIDVGSVWTPSSKR